MALLDNGNLSAADVAAVVGNNGGGANGFGGGWFWVVILFLFAMFGNNGWGNNAGNGSQPIVLANGGFGGGSVQQVIDQQSVMNGITNLSTQLNNGFSNAEVSRCNQQANILQQLNNMAMNQQNCCCENRAAIADLKYTVATENCEDRNQLQLSTRDIIANDNNNYQKIMDKMCQLELDGIKQNYESQLRAQAQQIQELQSRVQTQAFNASQNAQTAQLMADNANQTVALENYLDPPIRPSYIVPNPNAPTPVYYQGGCCGRRYA